MNMLEPLIRAWTLSGFPAVWWSGGGFELRAYTVFCALGGLMGYALLRHEARLRDWDARATNALAVQCGLFGFLGAHALYLATRSDLPAREWFRVLVRVGYGNVWYGGLLAAAICFWRFARKRGLSPWSVFDVFALAAVLAQLPGRLGCLFNGCCYGKPTSLIWGIVAPAASPWRGARLHPVPLYEIAWLGAVFWFLWWCRSKNAAPGKIAAFYLVLAPGGRFFLEFLRGDSIRGFVWGTISTSQAIALPLVAYGVYRLRASFSK